MSLNSLILIVILFAHRSLQWSPEDCDSGDLSHFSPPGPVTALFSRPGSGATWVRHLLELATGYETGSVYRDSQALLNGFSGEGIKDGSVLVVKDHFWENSLEYDRAIVVIRHPINQYMSAMNHYHSKSHTQFAPVEKFRNWSQDLKIAINHWQDLHARILSTLNDVCVIFYEELQENPILALSPCLQFLGFELKNTLLKECILQNLEGSFRRGKRDPREIATIMSYIDPEVLQHAEKMYQRFKAAFISRYNMKNSHNEL